MVHYIQKAISGTQGSVRWKIREIASRLLMKRGKFKDAKI